MSAPGLPDLDDTGEIPILTDAIDQESARDSRDRGELQLAIVSEVEKLAESLLHDAARSIEATLFENVLDRLRAELPEIVDRLLRERAAGAGGSTEDD
ncbi:MAG: hypothetical protein KGL34_06340 [Gammaproteobacteria bacterium]|nr:hypothetical protein [Gammaproteobacteria bacterium]